MRRNSQLKGVNSIEDQKKGGSLVAGFCSEIVTFVQVNSLCFDINIQKYKIFLSLFFFFPFSHTSDLVRFCCSLQMLFQTSVHGKRKYFHLANTDNGLQSACWFLTGAYEPSFNNKIPQILAACFSFARYKQSTIPDRGNVMLTGVCLQNVFDSWLHQLIAFIY